MEVTFRRTGERRYAIGVQREEFPDVEMDPAPGYDAELPHDLVHFVVESELGLSLGVFGQLANGGHAGTFRRYRESIGDAREASRRRRRDDKRGARLMKEGHEDAVLSENAAAVCEYEWAIRSDDPDRRREARAMAPYVTKVREELSKDDLDALSEEVLDSICERLEALSGKWKALGVGDELTVSWSL